MRAKLNHFLKKGYLTLLLIFLYLPILIMAVFSFNASRTRGQWSGFSLKWYQELFHDPTIMQALYTTLLVAVLSALIATVIGTVAAIGIYSMKRRPRAALLNLTYIPGTNPDIVTGISLMLLFLFIKLPMGFGTLLIAHITFNVPYVILSVMPKLQQMNTHLYEAALDLGAPPRLALVKVILPQIMPGIFTGALLAFTLSLDDFVVSFFTNGGTQTLSVVVYSMARLGVKPQINALSTIMFVCVLVLLFIVNKRTARDASSK